MIDIYLILAGFGIGVVLAAPGGPVNILCVQRTLAHGFWAGLAVGIGAVIGDGLLAIMAASGLSVVSVFLVTFSAEIQLMGGLILVLFGLRLSRGRIEERVRADAGNARNIAPDDSATLRDHLHTIPQSFLMTVMNPGTMLGAFALFGGLASAFGSFPSLREIVAVVVAVVAGNLCWWLCLSHVVSQFRHRVCTNRLRAVNRFAAIALIVFGVLLVLRGSAEFDMARVAFAGDALLQCSLQRKLTAFQSFCEAVR